MGKTASSLDVYLKDVNEPAESVLRFFEDVSKEYKVSIIKTDSGDEVIKSGVFDKDTFPTKSLDFLPLILPQMVREFTVIKKFPINLVRFRPF